MDVRVEHAGQQQRVSLHNCGESVDDGHDLGVVVVEQHIIAGPQRQLGGLHRSEVVPDRPHTERVGDHKPAESEVTAQNAVDGLIRQCRGHVTEAGDLEVADHHADGRVRDHPCERQQIGRPQLFERWRGRPDLVGVATGMTMSGEVLHDREDPCIE